MYNIYIYIYISLAHSFYTCLKHQLIHLTIVLLRSIYIPWVPSCVVIYSTRYFYTVQKFTIGHVRVAARRGRLNYIHHQRERACAHP